MGAVKFVSHSEMYWNYIKRRLDFEVALVCLSPLLLVVTVWLHFANKGAGNAFVLLVN